MQTTQFDRQNLKQIRVTLEEALKPVAEKLGIHISLGGFSYDEKHFTSRLTANVKYAGTDVVIGKGGLPEIGTKFQIRNKQLEVVAHAPARPKFPIIVKERFSGRKYKVSTEQFEESIKGW